MKRVEIRFSDEEYYKVLKDKENSEFSQKGLSHYLHYLALHPEGEKVVEIDEKTREDIEELTRILAVYAYFAEKSDDVRVKKLFYEFDRKTREKINSIL